MISHPREDMSPARIHPIRARKLNAAYKKGPDPEMTLISPLSALILSLGTLGSVALATGYLHAADAQMPMPSPTGDQLLTMPILAEKGWFIHAHNGRVRACTADGASVAGERPAPKCSNWSE